MNFKSTFKSFFKNKRKSSVLSGIESNFYKRLRIMDDFTDFRLKKQLIIRNINLNSLIQKRRNKRQLQELCNQGLELISEEENIAKDENFFISLLENEPITNSKIHNFLQHGFSSEEKIFFQDLSRNKAILSNLRLLHKDILTNLFNLKRIIQQQISLIEKKSFFSLESIHEFNILLEEEFSNCNQLLKNLTENLRRIFKTHSLPFSTISSTSLYESDAEDENTFKRLLFVNLRDEFPYHGVMRTSLSQNQGVFHHSKWQRFPTFSTVHFTLNGPAEDVSGFLGPSWKGKKVAIIIPGYNFPKGRIVHFGNLDTFVEGNVKIPSDSYIITCKEVFSSEEERKKINDELLDLGINIIIVDEKRVYDETINFCKKVGRYSSFPAIINRQVLIRIADSLKASYSYDQYDSETISRDFTGKQNEIYNLITSIRFNKWKNKQIQEDGLLLNADILFVSLMVISESFILINKHSENMRFYKPIGILLNLIDSLLNLNYIFITNEIHAFKKENNTNIKNRIKQLTKDIPNRELSMYLHHEMRKFRPDLNEEIHKHFNKTLKNIQSKIRLMQEFCKYIEINL